MGQSLLATATSVQTVNQFKQWTKDHLRSILPHESLLCGWGHLSAGGVGLDYVVTVDYPVEHVDSIRNRAGAIDTPVLRRWLTAREPVIFDAASPWADTPATWLDSFRRYDLRNIAAHAIIDTERCVGTYHSFSRIPGTPGQRHCDALIDMVPVMHEVFCRVIENHRVEDPIAVRLAALTEREREIVQWVGLGKTNTEIAALSYISESTVKHHMSRVFDKLDVANRAQLVRYLADNEIRQVPAYGTRLL